MSKTREDQILAIKERVYRANIALKEEALIKLTWGNVSECDRDLGLIVIKPSGVPYDEMKPEDMVVVDLSGDPIDEDQLKASSDLPTHVRLYQAFSNVNSVVHTHSTEAVKWAQAGRSIPVYGTTHADTFYGQVPCTRHLTEKEVKKAYELETANVIIETFEEQAIDPLACPAVVVRGHGPFTWGSTTQKAVEHSIILEEVAKMALGTETLNPDSQAIPSYLLDKHYLRKHGKDAYYGQK